MGDVGGANQQGALAALNPHQAALRDILRPTLDGNHSAIVLSQAAMNHDLKVIHFNMLPSFDGLATEDPLQFFSEFLSTL